MQTSALSGKHIVLGITGSIAAYKACLLVRLLIKAGAEVQVVITPAGKEFITPVTLSALTSKPVVSEFFSQRDGSWHSHVDLGLWADAMVIAPATASTIGKMAHGIAASGEQCPMTGPVEAPEKRPSVMSAMERPSSLSELMASDV